MSQPFTFAQGAEDYYSDEDGSDDEANFADLADTEATAEDVIQYIEELVIDYVKLLLTTSKLPTLSVLARDKNAVVTEQAATMNPTQSHMAPFSGNMQQFQHTQHYTASQPFVSQQYAAQQGNTFQQQQLPDSFQNAGTTGSTYGLRMKYVVKERRLTTNKGAQAYSYVRVFAVLNSSYGLVKTGCTATQRELYYRLLFPPIIKKASHVNESIQDVVTMVGVPRISLGICCSSRGAVAGTLLIKEPHADGWTDCRTLDQAGKSIPGNTALIGEYELDALDAACVLVIEKDAIFQRVCEDRIFDLLPMVVITAKGMPDLATRSFLHLLHTTYPMLPVLALVDYNPSGVNIAMVYKYGSKRMGLESPCHAVPALRWLAARSEQLAGIPTDALQPLTQRDHGLINTLSTLYRQSDPLWVAELETMHGECYKGEIEALYNITGGPGGLVQYLIGAITRKEYI